MNEHGVFLTIHVGKTPGWGSSSAMTSSMTLSVEVSALNLSPDAGSLLTLECGLLKILGGKKCVQKAFLVLPIDLFIHMNNLLGVLPSL